MSDVAPVEISRPRAFGGLATELRELWSYRALILTLLTRELKARHRMTALGPLWFVLAPAMQMIVFSLVFGGLFNLPSGDYPYAIFLYAGLLPWIFFEGLVNQCTVSLHTCLPWMSKVYFPRLIAVIVFVLALVVDWSFSLLMMVGLMLYFGVPITGLALWLPVFLLMATLIALSISFFTAPMTIFFRDCPRFVQYVLQAGKWLTPVVYSREAVNESLLWLFELNPMYWVVEGFRWALLPSKGKVPVGVAPSAEMLLPMAVCGVLLLVGIVFFHRAVKNIADMA